MKERANGHAANGEAFAGGQRQVRPFGMERNVMAYPAVSAARERCCVQKDGRMGMKKIFALLLAKFKSREKRAEIRARYQLTSSMLNLIGMQNEIPNYRVLPYLDETAEMFNDSEAVEEFENLKRKALSVLVNITEKEVKRNPNEEPSHTFSENNEEKNK